MSINSDNRLSDLGKRQISSVMLASLVLLSQTINLSAAIAATSTSSSSSKPVLKAIDPSQAKMDSIPKPQAPASSLNPDGGIQGAPISANKPTTIPGQSPPGWTQQPYQQSGYPPAYGAQPGYPQYQQPGYPAYQQGYPPPSAPPGYPSYPPQQQPYYGQRPPAYGAPYGQPAYQSAPVTSPPGYPTMPPQTAYPNYNMPPGFVQPGANNYQRPPGFQQPPQNAYQPPAQNPPPGNFPTGRSQFGGGHPNLVPQGAPQQTGPQGSPGFGSGNFASNPGGSYQQPPGFVQSQGGYPPQSSPPGYPQQASYGGAGGGGTTGGQFASNNYPSPNLIPDFGKPLPLDASSRGPAQMWTTNQVVPARGNPATGYGAPPGAPPSDPNEARVARLEKIAFGSTYPEHEVEDRVDHLEKEIFTDKSTGDIQERLNRLEKKLCGGSNPGSFGSPMRQSGQYGSYAGGSTPVALAPSMPPSSRPAGGAAAANRNGFGNPVASGQNSGGGNAATASGSTNPGSGLVASELALSSANSTGDKPNGSGSTNPTGDKSNGSGSTSPTNTGLVAPELSLSKTDGGKSGSETAGESAAPEESLSASPLEEEATQLALKSPDDPPSSQGSIPSGSAGSSDDDEGSGAQSPADDSTTAQDDTGSMPADASDEESSPPASDTTDGVSAPKGKGPGAADLKAMASGSSTTTESNTKARGKTVAPKIPYDKNAGDYANRISRFVNSSAARWTSFPVRVRLPEDGNSEWKKSMESGIEKWGRYIPLKKATVSETADIEVSFVNHLTPRVLGVTRLTVTGGRMKVFVFMLRPNYYPAIPQKVLSHAFLHELGHAIGIFGHSDKPTDAMFTFEIASNGKLTQEKLGVLSTRDVNTLKVIYDAKPLPDDFNMSAPQEWGYTHEAS